ncbi:MAG TPA: TonB-dependent receptor [Candidatus Polarisedimenticolaceae bacterium]|nr:TonB-dependent receptor [Candidatus Polarisedimenticolaceae bacterium]
MARIAAFVLVLVLCSAGSLTRAQQGVPVMGKVLAKSTGAGIPGVVVLVSELQLTDETDSQGRFRILDVPPGTYHLVLTLGGDTSIQDLVVPAEGTTDAVFEVEWTFEEVRVVAEELATKVVDAPAAVTAIHEEEIQQQAAQGQVPKLLEFTPGAEVTQSGLYDFNFNTRGFNSSLNRRVSTYIDGRDVGVVLLGAQEWAAIAGGLDDIAQLEFVRGPSAALYGANASSGVVNITTRPPKTSPGGMARFTGGELDTVSLDVRHTAELGNGWWGKLVAGFKDSGDFTVSRNPDVVRDPEYVDYAPDAVSLSAGKPVEFCLLTGLSDCLPAERTLLREQDNAIRFGALRLDKYFDNGSLFTVETGASVIKGPVFQTGIGRVQNVRSQRPFYRLNWSNDRWNVLGHYTSRDGEQVNLMKELRFDYDLITQEQRYGLEGQGKWTFGGTRGRLVAGGSYTREHVNSVDHDTGRQTVLYEPISSHREALFSQADWQLNERIKLVGAGRVDWSTLHDTQFSPKAAMVFNLNQTSSLRLTYNRAFQVANYSEFFLHTPIASFPIGGFVRTICHAPLPWMPPEGVDCGIEGDYIPILAVGNDDLKLEKTEAWELGYSGVLAQRVYVTVDYYRAKNKDFITDLVPQVGTVLGNTEGCLDVRGNPTSDPRECPINNDYGAWVGPEEAETTFLLPPGVSTEWPDGLTVAQALRNAVDNSVGGNTLGFRLGQDLNGAPVVVGRTYTNVGRVDTQGVDVGIQYFITPGLSVQASYSWFDFTIVDPDVGSLSTGIPDEEEEARQIADILLPNTPEHKGSLAISLNRKRWSVSLAGRWVQHFRWSAGVFQGDVPDYSTYDLGGTFRINKFVGLGVNVANLRDTPNRQTFGGDVLRRRALANLTFAW